MRTIASTACTLAFATIAIPIDGQTQRPLDVNDVIALQDIRRVAVAPNGEWLAVVVKRPGGPLTDGDEVQSDVWLIPRRGGSPRNLTIRTDSSARWWNPVWSPDGQRLAMLSTGPDGRIAVQVWTMRSDKIVPVVDRDMDVHAATDATWPAIPMVWVDSVSLLCATLPKGLHPGYVWGSDTWTQRAAPREWHKTDQGDVPAVSVLESGRAITNEERPQGQLLRANVVTGVTRVIADGNFWQIILSPTLRYAALIEDAGGIPPTATRPLLHGERYLSIRRTRLILAPLDSDAAPRWIRAITDPDITLGPLVPHVWAADGRTLVVVAKRDSTEQYASTAYLVDAPTGGVRQISDRSLEVTGTAWANRDAVLILARPTAFANTNSDTTRDDWWVVNAHRLDGMPKRITSALSSVPRELMPAADTNCMLGIAAGRLVAVDVDGGRSQCALALPRVADSIRFRSLLWPNGTGLPVTLPTSFFLATDKGGIYELVIRGGEPRLTMRAIPKPSAIAELAALDASHHVRVFTAAERNGSFLWTTAVDQSTFDVRLALNRQLSAIADARRILIQYTGVDGDSLKGLLVLPIGYRPDQRYPLITWVYAGQMIADTLGNVDKQEVSPLNLALIPAHGYALLIPSMPIDLSGRTSDPMIEMTKNVMPAIDEAIRLGVADPSRLGVMGHSYGGYAAYSLITYTHRFRAAVAMAGLTDLASLYGTFDARTRYADFGYEMEGGPSMLESGVRMGSAPWDGLWRYLRNSPVFYVDRIQTPVMIVQGDADYIGIEQGEEFFSALYRLGKPARFVRYWGDTHVIYRSPANVRDMWHRIFEWFDEQLNVQGRSSVLGESRTGHSQTMRDDPK